jgi:ubiquinone/menaquinone biosynthesis C-methylase UbiE
VDKILDIGCGKNKIPHAVGIDIDKSLYPDILHDLNIYPYPIKDNEFDKIYAKHVIEHVNDPTSFIKECYRILKPGGTMFVETPHFSSRVAYSEPDHKRFFSYFMFSGLLSKVKFSKTRQRITFYKSFRRAGISFLANRFPDAYERFWTYIFPAENVILEAQK